MCSTHSCVSTTGAVAGASCRVSSEIGTRFTCGSTAGAWPACWNGWRGPCRRSCWPSWIWTHCRWTARSFPCMRTERAPWEQGCQAIGHSRRGLTTRLHVPVANDGVSLTLNLSPGQRRDAPCGRELLRRLGPDQGALALLMDHAYEDDTTRRLAAELGYQPVVPPKSNRLGLGPTTATAIASATRSSASSAASSGSTALPSAATDWTRSTSPPLTSSLECDQGLELHRQTSA